MPKHPDNVDRLRNVVCEVVDMVIDKLEARFSVGVMNRLIRGMWILSALVLILSITVLVMTLITRI